MEICNRGNQEDAAGQGEDAAGQGENAGEQGEKEGRTKREGGENRGRKLSLVAVASTILPSSLLLCIVGHLWQRSIQRLHTVIYSV